MEIKINLSQLANVLQAYQNCKESGNKEWQDKHKEKIDEILIALPSGSGIDSGVTFDLENSRKEKLVFLFSFHHMNDNGYYDGWSNYKLVVVPSFIGGYDLKITGRNRNQVIEYLYQLFDSIFYVYNAA